MAEPDAHLLKKLQMKPWVHDVAASAIDHPSGEWNGVELGQNRRTTILYHLLLATSGTIRALRPIISGLASLLSQLLLERSCLPASITPLEGLSRLLGSLTRHREMGCQKWRPFLLFGKCAVLLERVSVYRAKSGSRLYLLNHRL